MRAWIASILSALATIVATTIPGVAHAQQSIGGSLGEGELVRLTTIPAIVEGRLAVDFAANAATGCAAPCDLSGRIVWTPSRYADLNIAEYRVKGRARAETTLDFEDPGDSRPATTAVVTRGAAPPSSLPCQDMRADEFESLDFTGDAPGTAIIRLAAAARSLSAGADILSTRCAGPLARDVAAALPAHTLPVDSLRKGSTSIDLSASSGFAASGMAGTVRSTIVLRLERPSVIDASDLEAFAQLLQGGGRGRAIRTLTATYDVERLGGDLVARFEGSAQPELCGPLDSCGARGSVRVTHAATAGQAVLSAIGPGRRTRRQLGAALGLNGGRRGAGISTFGAVFWETDAGRSVASSVDPAGTPCTGTASLGGGLADLAFSPRRLTARYATDGIFYGGDPFRTRCPGPTFGDASDGGRPLATGSVPLRALRGMRVTIALDRGGAFASDGYTGTVQPALRIVLRRVSVRSSVFTFPDLSRLGR